MCVLRLQGTARTSSLVKQKQAAVATVASGLHCCRRSHLPLARQAISVTCQLPPLDLWPVVRVWGWRVGLSHFGCVQVARQVVSFMCCVHNLLFFLCQRKLCLEAPCFNYHIFTTQFSPATFGNVPV